MPLYPHTLHIYQKPKLGSAFIKRYTTLNYQHKISIMGWFDTASCNVIVTRAEAERMFGEFVGNRVAVYVDNPAEPIWEGLINRVTYNAGGLILTRSLENMANRVRVNWDRNSAGTLATLTNTAANNTDSQALYGIKEMIMKGKYHRSTAQANTVDRYRDRIINEVPYPQVSTNFGGGNYLVRIEMVGFYHTLKWDYLTVTANAATVRTQITNQILPNLANGSTFLDNTDFSELDTPGTTVQTELDTRTAETHWDAIVAGTEYGDGTNRWIAGVTPTRSTGTRRLYYREADRTVRYTARVADGLRIRNEFGGLIRPWTMTPDASIRVTDILVGWNQPGEDPRETYIVGVDYDAESGRAHWVGEDDVSVDGIFKLFKNQKEFNSRFGQAPNRISFS